jgi:hypothetical protein
MTFTPPPTQMGQVHRMRHESPALHSRPHYPLMEFSQQEMKIYHSKHNYMRETSLESFSVHYSANNEEVNTQFCLAIPPMSALLIHSFIYHTLYVAKWQNHSGNQLKWNGIHGTVVVKLYSSHFSGESRRKFL